MKQYLSLSLLLVATTTFAATSCPDLATVRKIVSQIQSSSNTPSKIVIQDVEWQISSSKNIDFSKLKFLFATLNSSTSSISGGRVNQINLVASCHYGYQLNDPEAGINLETTTDGTGFPLSTNWTHGNGNFEWCGLSDDFKTLVPTLAGQCRFEID